MSPEVICVLLTKTINILSADILFSQVLNLNFTLK